VLADRDRRISLADVAGLAVTMGWDYLIIGGVHVPAVTSGRKTGGQRAFLFRGSTSSTGWTCRPCAPRC
jgi:hypothetical protein